MIRAVLTTALIAGGGAWAAESSVPTAWSNIAWFDYLFNGQPVRDVDQDASSDPSSGAGGASPDRTDISSGATGPADASNANCNPPVASGACGTATSVFWGVYDGGTPYSGSDCASDPGGTWTDDYFAFRMRINADPRTGGGFDSNHWNFLLDIDGDGYKEFYVDIDGTFQGGNKDDRLEIFYENNDSNRITDPDTALRERFIACDSTTASGTCARSHTRSYSTADGTGEFYIEAQVPIIAFTSDSGVQQLCPGSPFAMFTSTSASNTDPLQKDFSQPCPGVNATPEEPCDFGDTTPVTLTAVRSEVRGGRLLIEWHAENEVLHLGYRVYLQGSQGLVATDGQIRTVASEKAGQGNRYAVTVDVPDGLYYIADVDLTGHETIHGPYLPGQVHGERGRPEAVDWAAVRAELRVHEESQTKARGPDQRLARLRLDTPGIHRISYEDLSTAGSLQASHLALTRGTERHDLYLSGGSQFGAGDYLELVADIDTTLYANWAEASLRLEPGAGRRVAVGGKPKLRGNPVMTYRATSRHAPQRIYQLTAPGDEPYAAQQMLTYTTPRAWQFPLQIDAAAGGEGRLRVVLWGVTDWPGPGPDHHVEVLFDGQPLGDVWFDGSSVAEVDYELPASLLYSGAHQVTLRLPGDSGQPFDMVALDAIEAVHDRQLVLGDGPVRFEAAGDWFQVAADSMPVVYRTDGNRRTRLEVAELGNGQYGFDGTRAMARYDLATESALGRPTLAQPRAFNIPPTTGFDYLVLSHEMFIPALAELAAVREAEGHRVAIVDVADVYDHYGRMVPDAAAIAQYVRAVGPNLRNVLLVGGDTRDYMGHEGSGSVSFLPTIYAPISDLIRFAPADALYGDLDDDGLPDVPVGRWPVRGLEELQHIVDRTLAWGGEAHAREALIASDAGDGIMDFGRSAAFLESVLPAGWTARQVAMEGRSVASARQALFEGLAAGPSLVAYFGHASFDRWSFSRLLSIQDVPGLYSPAAHVVSQFGCWNTYFVEPRANTLGHALMLSPTGEAVALMGPSALSDARHQARLGQILWPRMLTPGVSLGDALTATRRELGAGDHLRNVVAAWTLLGDPSLVMVQ